MAAENDSIRSEISGKFQPPVEVLLDPSLLVADVLLTRLADSAVFTSQTQATLDQPTTPHVGDLYVPATFYKSLNSQKQIDLQQTSMWNIFRGQAEGALSEGARSSSIAPSSFKTWTDSIENSATVERGMGARNEGWTVQ